MSTIIEQSPLGFMWVTQDPFLFCAHHLDYYPKGSHKLGPDMPLSRRNLGQDFDLSNDWKMYHGMEVPGFPEHPHRGFETVTIVLDGFVDHSDSAGASGRYGEGDVQWMTAGRGMQHAEMFPLLDPEGPNTLHLFQVWLNLPKKEKFVEPHFKMLWNEDIPVLKLQDEAGKITSLKLISGRYKDISAVEAAPDSWAAEPANNVDIFIVEMMPGAIVEIASKSTSQKRALYFYEGDAIEIDGQALKSAHQAFLGSDAKIIKNLGGKASFLILQAEPINEPVAKYGPFVMNTRPEIQQAYNDYQKTRFGGWPWETSEPVHGSEMQRFAKYSDGSVERRSVK